MNELDTKTKEEIVNQINYIFEPIGGVFSSFGDPWEMFMAIRDRYSTESIMQEKNKIITYPILIKTKLGDLNMSLHSDDLHNIKSAIGISLSYSDINKLNPSLENIKDIQERIYL